MIFDCFNIKLQNMRLKVFLAAILVGFIFFSCSDKDDVSVEPQLIIKFKFDPSQVRLNNLGQPSTLPSGNAAQSPVFNSIRAHYFDLAPNQYTALEQDSVL